MSTATMNNNSSSSGDTASNDMKSILAQYWWLIALRGVLGIIFGLIAFIMPVATILALVLLFSAYMLVDGLFSIIAAIRAARRRQRWGLLTVQAIASIATGVIAFILPGITVLAFVLLVAAWAIVSGSVMLGAAFRTGIDHGRWWLALAGIAGLLYGALMILAPLAGAIVLTWWLGAFALVLGVTLLVLAFRLHSRRQDRPTVAEARPAT
jgi:uncharacterized membrane protein HdeD (DUF308 family)